MPEYEPRKYRPLEPSNGFRVAVNETAKPFGPPDNYRSFIRVNGFLVPLDSQNDEDTGAGAIVWGALFLVGIPVAAIILYIAFEYASQFLERWPL